MGSTNSDSESQRSVEEERTESGHSHEENGDVNDNGISAALWRASEKSLLTLAFPVSRVRRLVKSGGDAQWVGVEAGFLIAKAAVRLMLHKSSVEVLWRFIVTRECILPSICWLWF